MHKITMIVAKDLNGVIGKQGKVPWHLRADMLHFKSTTEGKIVIMGRKTYDSLPAKFKPLPNRWNVILTRNQNFPAPKCTILTSPEEVLQLSQLQEVFVIGGEKIYKLFMPFASSLIVTEVNVEVIDGDAFFPPMDQTWSGRIIKGVETDEKNPFSFWIVEYTRTRV